MNDNHYFTNWNYCLRQVYTWMHLDNHWKSEVKFFPEISCRGNASVKDAVIAYSRSETFSPFKNGNDELLISRADVLLTSRIDILWNSNITDYWFVLAIALVSMRPNFWGMAALGLEKIKEHSRIYDIITFQGLAWLLGEVYFPSAMCVTNMPAVLPADSVLATY